VFAIETRSYTKLQEKTHVALAFGPLVFVVIVSWWTFVVSHSAIEGILAYSFHPAKAFAASHSAIEGVLAYSFHPAKAFAMQGELCPHEKLEHGTDHRDVHEELETALRQTQNTAVYIAFLKGLTCISVIHTLRTFSKTSFFHYNIFWALKSILLYLNTSSINLVNHIKYKHNYYET